jgi:hypothetical protein
MLFPCIWQDGTGPADAATLVHLHFSIIQVGHNGREFNLPINFLRAA